MTDASRFVAAFGLCLVALMICSGLALCIGAMPIPPRGVLTAMLRANPHNMNTTVVRTIRAPRVVAACIVGAALALAGLCFQVLLRNSLASEYTLGVSSGAALGAVCAALAHMTSPLASPAFAFIGGMVAIAAVLCLAHARFSFETNGTILTGVIFTSLANAALSLILSLASPNELHVFLFWFMGSFANADWPMLRPAMIAVGVLSLTLYSFAGQMNALAVGDDFAAQAGVAVAATKGSLFVLASLLTASVISVAGTVGFVGLIVPHFARLAVGTENRKLIPVAAVGGATLCVTADLLARTLLPPNDLPAGVVMAFVAAPVFVALLRRRT